MGRVDIIAYPYTLCYTAFQPTHQVLHPCVFRFTFQAEDGIRDYYASRGLGDVYKRQILFDQNSGFVL